MTKQKSSLCVLQVLLVIAFGLVRTSFGQSIEPTVKRSDDLKVVRVNGVELHYLERGAGVPIIFIHGGLDDYRSWKSQLEPFAEHYRVITYSRRYNYPNHNPDIRADHSALVEAADLALLIKSLKLGRVHLVGASYGAYTALVLALKHPELVRSITLAEAPVARLIQNTEQGNAAFDELMEKLWKPTGNAFRRGDKESALRITLDYFLGQGVSSQIPDEVLQGWRDNLLEWQALTTSKDAYPNLSREDLRRLRVPVLMLSGEKTLSLLKLVDAELQVLIRGVERKIIPNATHDMWNEEPEICRKAVLEFVGKH